MFYQPKWFDVCLSRMNFYLCSGKLNIQKCMIAVVRKQQPLMIRINFFDSWLRWLTTILNCYNLRAGILHCLYVPIAKFNSESKNYLISSVIFAHASFFDQKKESQTHAHTNYWSHERLSEEWKHIKPVGRFGFCTHNWLIRNYKYPMEMFDLNEVKKNTQNQFERGVNGTAPMTVYWCPCTLF